MTLNDLLAMPSIEQLDYITELSDEELDTIYVNAGFGGGHTIEEEILLAKIETELTYRTKDWQQGYDDYVIGAPNYDYKVPTADVEVPF